MKKVFTTFVFVIATIIAFAQTGEIQGRILDPFDSGIAKAKIAVLDSAGNVVKKLSATSDFAGDYSLKALPSGTYSIQVMLKSYRTETLSGVIVLPNKPTFLNFRLRPSATISE